MKKLFLPLVVAATVYGGGSDYVSENTKKCIMNSQTTDQVIGCIQADLTTQGSSLDYVKFEWTYGDIISEKINRDCQEAYDKGHFGQMANCTNFEMSIYDKVLNIKYKSVLERFTNDKSKLATKEPSKNDFVAAQRVWLKMKEGCMNIREEMGGRDYPPSLIEMGMIAQCELDMTKDRVKYFEYIIETRDVKE